MTTTAAVYLRISLDKTGEELGVTRQREDCLAECKRRGWTPVEYVDNDLSASRFARKDRPAYQRMLADMRDGKVQAVVTYKADRLHRKPSEGEEFIDIANAKHIELATVTGFFELSTSEGRAMYRQMCGWAAYESDVKSDRQCRAAKQLAERGKPKWRKAFGYLPETRPKEEDDGTRQPDERTAPLVKEAYRMVLAGNSLGDICRMLNGARAYGLNGKPWTATTISLFLRNPRNAGLRAHNGEIVGQGTWPGLVDENTWHDAQSVLNQPSRKPGRKSVQKHLLTGMLTCGKCGHHLSGMWGTQAHKDSPKAHSIVYGCKGCRGVSIRAEHVEPLLSRYVAERLSRPDAIDLLLAEQHDTEQAQATRDELSGLYARLDTIAADYAEGLLDARQLKTASDIVRTKIATLEAAQQDQDRVRVFADLPLGQPEIIDKLSSLSEDRYRAVLDVLLTATVAPVGKGHRVNGERFDPDRLQITWRS